MPFILRTFSWAISYTFLSLFFVNFPPADQSDKERQRGESRGEVRKVDEQGGDSNHGRADGRISINKDTFKLLASFLLAPG